MDYTICIIDDELEMCLSLAKLLKIQGYSTIYTTNPLETSSILENEQVDLIIMDIKMPHIGGIDLLKTFKKQDISIPVIMITGYPTFDNAVRAMKYGAINVYTKPLNFAEMLKEIHELVTQYALKRARKQGIEHKIVTNNPTMQQVLKTLKKAAPTTAPVLITGESGTGKELIANSLHHLSPRANKPFVKVNCAALPDELLESELFGHERGAFTGAVKEHKGRFELADTGTIFLDEIGDMSLKTQAKILRAIQEHKFQRVGGTRTIQTDIRLITATNKNLKELIEQKMFREDLYYRLSVITIHLPPLRERKDDTLLLSEYFITYYNTIHQKAIKGISEELRWFFLTHNWPGNVRELKNCIERAAIFCESDIIGVEDLAAQYADLLNGKSPDSYEKVFESLTRESILDALEKSGGVKQKAADLLNISRRTLYNRMKKLGLH